MLRGTFQVFKSVNFKSHSGFVITSSTRKSHWRRREREREKNKRKKVTRNSVKNAEARIGVGTRKKRVGGDGKKARVPEFTKIKEKEEGKL